MKEEKHYTQWTREEFEKLPYPESFHNTIGEVESLIILPETHVHDSGFRCMSFVAIQNGKPTYRISGCSDVIHLGGVGGYNWQNSGGLYGERMKTKTTFANGWRIDCLPVSGLLRIFSNKKLSLGVSVSDFELFFEED